MTYFGRYKKPDGTWMKWLKFSGHDTGFVHCNRMAAGRECDLLSEHEYNLKYNQVPDPKETDSTGAFQRLITKLEEPEDIGALEEDDQGLEKSGGTNSQELKEKKNVGRPRIDRPTKELLQRLYVDQGLSIRTIAGKLGLKRDFIHSCLREYGIETRLSFRPSKLASYPLELVKEKARSLGYERAACEFGVALSTLYFYVKTR